LTGWKWHLRRDVDLVWPDALDDDVALAAADDEIVLLGIGADVLEIFVDAVGEHAGRLFRPQAGQSFCFELAVHRAHPTLPSRLMDMSFCASTANSIGNCCNTSLTKPLTTKAVASSADLPRCRQ